jgi:hypothetical protein
MAWRDFLGRFARRPAPREPEPSPELGPMARHAISWLEKQPDAAKMLGALAEPEPPPEPRASRRPESEAAAHPFVDLAEKAAALTARVDNLAVRDDRWVKLARAGYTEEGLAEISRFAAHRGIQDPIAAAAQLEREVGHAEPIVQSGHRSFHTLAQAEERRSDTAFEALLDGDDEQWLAYSVNAALKEVRGQY